MKCTIIFLEFFSFAFPPCTPTMILRNQKQSPTKRELEAQRAATVGLSQMSPFHASNHTGSSRTWQRGPSDPSGSPGCLRCSGWECGVWRCPLHLMGAAFVKSPAAALCACLKVSLGASASSLAINAVHPTKTKTCAVSRVVYSIYKMPLFFFVTLWGGGAGLFRLFSSVKQLSNMMNILARG